jgi:hypothetical protein
MLLQKRALLQEESRSAGGPRQLPLSSFSGPKIIMGYIFAAKH